MEYNQFDINSSTNYTKKSKTNTNMETLYCGGLWLDDSCTI